MGPAIGGSLVMAIGITITPLAITAAALMVTTRQAGTNGLAFLAGWFGGLVLVGGVALVVMGSTAASHSGTPATWISWLKIVSGSLLCLVALVQFLPHAHSGRSNVRDRWAEKLGGVTPRMALGLGGALAGARPKNILLIMGGAAVIAGTGISARDQAICYAIFAAIATIGVSVPVAIYFVMGERSPQSLRTLEEWISTNSSLIMLVLGLVVGVYLIGAGILGLA